MRKGQTALEYLMTYGWAILIVVIVVGALYALGLTNPCRWTGTQIREFADFRVDNAKFTTTSLEYDLSYLKPGSVRLDSVDVTGDVTSSTHDSPPIESLINSTAVRYTENITTTLSAGDCYTAEVTIEYNVTTAGGNETFTTAGKISGIVSS